MDVLIIDGLNLIRRIYAAIPVSENGDTHQQTVLSACEASLLRALRQHRPTHVLLVLDGGGTSWRHDLYPDYKKNRKPMPAPLHRMMPAIRTMVEGNGVFCLSVDRFEADDVVASIAQKARSVGFDVTVLSTDKSFCQLLSQKVRIYDHFGKHYLDRAYVHDRFEVEVDQLVDLFALAGDPSTNIPGVPSVGQHTAAKLLKDFHDLEGVFRAADNIAGKLGSKLRSGKANAELSKQLFALRTDIEVGCNFRDLRYRTPEPGTDT